MTDENFIQSTVADIVKLSPGEGDLITIVFRGPMTREIHEDLCKAGERLKVSFPHMQILVVDDRVNLNLLTAEELRMVGYLHNDHLCQQCKELLKNSYHDEMDGTEEEDELEVS